MSAVHKNNFSRQKRILHPADYSKVFEGAEFKVGNGVFLILARKNALLASRIGMVVRKKHLKKATDRNLVKRWIRESFRVLPENQPMVDSVVLLTRSLKKDNLCEVYPGLKILWQKWVKYQQRLSSSS